MSNTSIGVIGAGAWGTALAIHLSRVHRKVCLWGRGHEALQNLINTRENKRYLPGISLPVNITVCPELATLIKNSAHIVIATPSTAMRTIMQAIHQHATSRLVGTIWACKGLELDTGKFLHQVASEELPATLPVAILSGPSFAQEVGQGLPTAVTIASSDSEFAQQAAGIFHHPLFRAYVSTDVTGVEIGGAFKNILAIASGINDGLAFGANARAALITRGITEMVRFGRLFNAQLETFMGLSGIGDIVLTCTEDLSRNRRFGLGIGAGQSAKQVEASIGQVIEGKYATEVIFKLANKMDTELPITNQVYEILYDNKPARLAVEDLLSRSLKFEVE